MLKATQLIDLTQKTLNENSDIDSIFKDTIHGFEKRVRALNCEIINANTVDVYAIYSYYIENKHPYTEDTSSKVQKAYVTAFLKTFKNKTSNWSGKNPIFKKIDILASSETRKNIDVYGLLPELMGITITGPYFNVRDDNKYYLQISINPQLKTARDLVLNNTEVLVSYEDAANIVCKDILTNVELIIRSIRLTEINYER